MTLMLYPNKKEPKGWRLQDKALNVNLYFPVSKYKTMSLAKEAGRIEEHKLLRRRKLLALKSELPINQLFHDDGRVKGVRVASRTINGVTVPILIAQLTCNGKQLKTDRRLKNKCFREAYRSLQTWILKHKDIERTPEISRMFNDAESLYRQLVKE
ncbi:hypothetical protein [Vibrio owensii]|uniref:hypothetical protein n=1 Tax=Vibrio owensii TaxID=696485 RepID=UPI0018F110A5|nr:hypothetical protein [Vibrio owensii]